MHLVQRMAEQLPSNKLQVVFLINNYHEVTQLFGVGVSPNVGPKMYPAVSQRSRKNGLKFEFRHITMHELFRQQRSAAENNGKVATSLVLPLPIPSRSDTPNYSIESSARALSWKPFGMSLLNVSAPTSISQRLRINGCARASRRK